MPNDFKKGLSEKEAEEILKNEGYNELPAQKKQSWFSVLKGVLSEPMLLLLIAAGVIYLFLGEIKDTLVLLLSVFVVIGISFYQQRKTERTLEALRDLSSPRATVIRDGEQTRIPSRELVPGDIIVIHEGDRVPADAAVLESDNLNIDESLLTGESLPVRKTVWDGKTASGRPGGDDLPFIYSGSLVTGGSGIAEVSCTGTKTEIGRIGKSLESIKKEDTLLQKETTKIVRYVAVIGAALCALVVIVYAITKEDLLGGFLAGLTLSMSMVPEEFPVVLVVFLTLGAWRISRSKVLTRRPAAIETLGAATVLCTDKTGTLTMNKMELECVYRDGEFFEIGNWTGRSLSEKFRPLLENSVLACQKNSFDPIEKELEKKENKFFAERNHDGFSIVKKYPLSKRLMALTQVWIKNGDSGFFAASKGAPESILSLCKINEEERKTILSKVREMSAKGMRILGVASARHHGDLPESQQGFDFKFEGLLGFLDPVRSTAPEAVREAYEAGMRVIMITGDYPGTAQFVAKEIGIKNHDLFLTGEDLESMSRKELREKIKTINIFARVLPEQKLAIVEALKANGEIAAMTGDGVNDAPALKAANIGIAMGGRGTDVAREASSLVLLNDDFSSIVSAVRLGRRIYDNLKGAMGYVLAIHVPIAGMTVLPLFFGMPMVLLPAHIAFLELIIDPACSTVFESVKEAPGIMKRPPRNLRQPLFDGGMVTVSVLQGLGVFLAAFILYVYTFKNGGNEFEARSIAFSTLVLGNLLLIAVNISWRQNIHKILLSANRLLLIMILMALLCLLAVLNIPFLSDLFHLAPLRADDFILILLALVLSLAWFEIFKRVNYKLRLQQ